MHNKAWQATDTLHTAQCTTNELHVICATILEKQQQQGIPRAAPWLLLLHLLFHWSV
jgi:hypothetical protein